MKDDLWVRFERFFEPLFFVVSDLKQIVSKKVQNVADLKQIAFFCYMKGE